MKTEKKDPAAKTKKDSRQREKPVTGENVAAVNRTENGATGRVRANSGGGLGNEGTNVSYEDEQRNG